MAICYWQFAPIRWVLFSGFFGPVISAPLMEKGHFWTLLVLAEIVIFSATFILPLFIPETLHFRNRDWLGRGSPFGEGQGGRVQECWGVVAPWQPGGLFRRRSWWYYQ
ncbi:uncharacterized protein BKA55DRAFT_562889 [Fusarium redolens]|uniref:Uncharacterized protein n=1 Tax=Fusarium redolens TaxID=48865 RepID=A0A9P9HNE4_FUSRE|nr:uncharacterized protein BKA55DRAFT_562889 [Fusarium redolens]KAH7259614.1 hypothetical protein BKA55DRAFT_562889 [Fusarium redolens]